jgi:Pleckstrin homology domain
VRRICLLFLNYLANGATRFGKLRLHGHIRVGKDRRAWQDLDCYLFSEMLICVKERKQPPINQFDGPSDTKKPKCTLKGSILIKKHLKEVETFAGSFWRVISILYTLAN